VPAAHPGANSGSGAVLKLRSIDSESLVWHSWDMVLKRKSKGEVAQNALMVVEIATGAPLVPGASNIAGHASNGSWFKDHVWTVLELVNLQEIATKQAAA